MNLGRHAGMWLWNVAVEGTILAFSVGRVMKTSMWNQIQDPERNEVGFRCHVGLAQSRENLYPVKSYLFNCSKTVPSCSCLEEIIWIVLCEPPTLKSQVQSHISICAG